MNLPSFEEFIATLTEEDYARFYGEDLLKIYQLSDASQENINALIKDISSNIMVQSALYCRNFLGAYHSWLEKQLDQ